MFMPEWIINIARQVTDERMGLDSANAKTIIRSWDSQKADERLKALYKKHGKKYLPACKAFIEQEYRNIIVDSVVGLVHIDGQGKGELLNDLMPYKALAIARIPEILLSGKAEKKPRELTKKRKDKYQKFLVVEKDLEFLRGGQIKRVKATLKIGVENGENFVHTLFSKPQKQQKNANHTNNPPKKGGHPSGQQANQVLFYGGSHKPIKSQFDRLVNTEMAVTLLELTVVEL